MSKIVKKIKIMQPGGTLSDYVPIGAEAENINVDGESVETKLGKKPYYYNTVADMKADTKLKAGDMVVTLGYYAVNDGGSAEYNIIDDSGYDDNYYEELNNGLLAELIIKGKNIKAECIGFKVNDSSFDNSTLLESFCSNNALKDYILSFSIGDWYFDEVLINTNNIKIEGKFSAFTTTSSATIFKPFRANQRFILKIGGTSNFTEPAHHSDYEIKGCIIDKIVFSDSNYHLQIPTGDNKEKYGLLCLEYSVGGRFNIGFRNSFSRCIYLKNCWELEFENLYIRGNWMDPLNSLVYIDTPLADNSSNTSCLIFKNVDLESINSGFLSSNNNPKITNVIINTFSLENGRSTNNFPVDNGKIIETFTSDSLTLYQECLTNPLFNLASTDGLSINILNLHNFGLGYYYCKNGVSNSKYVDSIFNFRSYYNVSVNSINFNRSGGYITLATGDGYYLSNCNINDLNYGYSNPTVSSTGGKMIPAYVFYNTDIGEIFIRHTNAIINPQSYNSLKLKYYDNQNLYKICGREYGRLRMEFDDEVQNYVLCNWTSSTNAYFIYNAKVFYKCNIYIKGKLNNNVALNLVLVKNETETIMSVPTTSAERNVYKEYVYENINPEDYDYFYVKLNGGGTLKIQSVEIERV